MMRNDETVTARGYSISSVVMFLFAPTIAYLSVLATGTGWSPLVYLLGGIFIAVGLGSFLRDRLRRPWIGQLLLLLAIGVGSGAIGHLTAHPDPARLFEGTFGIAPPSDVSAINGRLQWYDGQQILLRFHASPDAVAKLVAARPLVRDADFEDSLRSSDPVVWRNAVSALFNLSVMADPNWRRSVRLNDPHVYKWEGSPPQGSVDHESVKLLINADGEAWALYNWG